MTIINLQITNGPVLSLQAVAEETTTSLPPDGDLVAKAIAIVKRSAEDKNFDQIDEPLKQLKASCKSKREEMQLLSSLVLKVKDTHTITDLPTIFRHLIEDFQVEDPLSITDFSDYPEAFRIACAKR